MAGWQQCIIVGNVGKDPEMRYTQSGTAVCNFSVAVTERWNDRQTNEKRESTTWYSCSAWNATAEICNQYVKKGMQVQIVGKPSASAYTAQDGTLRASLDLRIDNIQFFGSGGSDEGAPASAPRPQAPQGTPPPSKSDDIPF